MNKKVLITSTILAAAVMNGIADEAASKFTKETGAVPAESSITSKTNRAAGATGGRSAVTMQGDVASKTAKFGTISRSDEAYKTALDAHALDAALKQVKTNGVFKGTVSGIFQPRSGTVAIVNFDKDYKSAMTLLVPKSDFEKLPALTNLVRKEVVVTGIFLEFQGRPEIILTNAVQVRLVEAGK